MARVNNLSYAVKEVKNNVFIEKYMCFYWFLYQYSGEDGC